jgi:hypothetical protein
MTLRERLVGVVDVVTGDPPDVTGARAPWFEKGTGR